MPHIHFFIGIIISLSLEFELISAQAVPLFIIGSIVPDIDIIPGIILKTNHRTFWSHYLTFYLALTLLSSIFIPVIFWFFLGGTIHILTDIIDWEIYPLAPLSNFKVSIFNLNYNQISTSKNFLSYIKQYYSESKVVFTEICVIFLCGLVLIVKIH